MKRRFLLLVFMVAALVGYAEVKTINLTKPGTIGAELGNITSAASWTKLVITGPMNDDDFRLLAQRFNNGVCANLSTLDLSGVTGVTKIPTSAFRGTETLVKVSLPEQITVIGAGAFYGQKDLSILNLPEALTEIGSQAFYQCNSLIVKKLPSKLARVGKGTFVNCQSMEGEITIPATLTDIGEGAFGLTKITAFKVEDGNTAFVADASGVLYNRGKSLLVQVPGGIEGNVVVPEGVLKFGKFSVAGCTKLRNITIPSTVMEFGDAVFMNDEMLEKLHLPASLTVIGEASFANLKGLSDITVDEGNPLLSSVGGVLYDKNQTKLQLYPALKPEESYEVPSTVTVIDADAVSGQKYLKSIALPAGLTTIGISAFSEATALERIDIPASVDSIGFRAFAYCENLKTANLRNCKLETLNSGVFGYCTSLENISLPASLTSIESDALAATAIKTFVFPENVTKVGPFVFAYCENLTTVYLNSKMEYFGTALIYNLLFVNHTNRQILTDIYMPLNEPPVVGTDALQSISDEGKTEWSVLQNATLHVPAGCRNAYVNSELGESVGEIVEEGNILDLYKAALGQAVTNEVKAPFVGEKQAVGIYDVSGQKLSSLQKGLNIVRYNDGSAKKVMVK